MSPMMTVGLIFGLYLVLVVFMYREWIPAIWALPLMGALVLLASGGAQLKDYYTLVTEGVLVTAGAAMVFIFGGVFARAQIETGIVQNIIKRAVELGGDKPLVTVLLMAGATAYVTTGSFLGGIMLTATITIPIMVTLGVPSTRATTIHVLAATSTLLWWVQQWAYLKTVTTVTLDQMTSFLVVYTPIIGVVVLAYILWTMRGLKTAAANWAAASEIAAKVDKNVPVYALIAPIVPLILILAFKVPDLVAFLVGVPVTVLLAAPGSGRSLRDIGPFLNRIFLKGVEDMAYVTGLIIGIGIVIRAARFPFVAGPVTEVFKELAPSGSIAFIIVFSILLIGAIFRGPTMPWGMGAVTFAALIATNQYPLLAVGALAAVYNQFSYVADPTCAGVVWPCGYARVNVLDFMRRIFVWMLVIGVIGVILIPMVYKF